MSATPRTAEPTTLTAADLDALRLLAQQPGLTPLIALGQTSPGPLTLERLQAAAAIGVYRWLLPPAPWQPHGARAAAVLFEHADGRVLADLPLIAGARHELMTAAVRAAARQVISDPEIGPHLTAVRVLPLLAPAAALLLPARTPLRPQPLEQTPFAFHLPTDVEEVS